MFQQKILLFVCVLGLFSATSFAGSFESLEIAQGDGDPRESSVQDRLMDAKNLADEDVATVTAEGDFVVPTYLLQTVEESVVEEPVQITKKVEKELPVVVVTQTEVTPVSEQMAVERKLTGGTKQTEKIYSEAVSRKSAKLIKKTGASVSKAEKSKDKKDKMVSSTDVDINDILSGSYESESVSSDKKPLLLPLKGGAVKSKKVQANESFPKPVMNTYSSVYADKIIEAAKTNEKLPLIMPMDLKVSFYPNATDFSGKTIKWVKAFSYRALQDPRYVIQVRLSKAKPYLQEKRLRLVEKILMGAGLSKHQMVVDYVERPEDSLVLRMVKKEPDVSVKLTGKEKRVINW